MPVNISVTAKKSMDLQNKDQTVAKIPFQVPSDTVNAGNSSLPFKSRPVHQVSAGVRAATCSILGAL